MAFDNTVTINNGAVSPVGIVYAVQKVEPNGTTRISRSSPAGEPITFTIRHQKVGNKTRPEGDSDRRLLSYVHRKQNGAGAEEVLTANFTLTVPTSNLLTRANINDAIATLKNFLTSGNLDQLLLGES